MIHFIIFLASVKMKYEDAVTATISRRIGKVLAGSPDWDGNRSDRKRKKINGQVTG